MQVAIKNEGEEARDLQETLPKTIDEAVSFLESKFAGVSMGLQGPRDADDNPYITIAVGTTEPDQEQALIYSWLIAAMSMAMDSSRQYLAWRTMPVIRETPMGDMDNPVTGKMITSRQVMK